MASNKTYTSDKELEDLYNSLEKGSLVRMLIEKHRKLEKLVKKLTITDVVGRSELLSCGRNITTCVFYKDGGKCSNLEYCKDQTT